MCLVVFTDAQWFFLAHQAFNSQDSRFPHCDTKDYFGKVYKKQGRHFVNQFVFIFFTSIYNKRIDKSMNISSWNKVYDFFRTASVFSIRREKLSIFMFSAPFRLKIEQYIKYTWTNFRNKLQSFIFLDCYSLFLLHEVLFSSRSLLDILLSVYV